MKVANKDNVIDLTDAEEIPKISWGEQFEWLNMRSLQLDPHLKPAPKQSILQVWVPIHNAGQNDNPPLTHKRLVQAVEELYQHLSAGKIKWITEVKSQALPVLSVSQKYGLMLLHSRNPDGSWMIETSKGLENLKKLPADALFTAILGTGRRIKDLKAWDLFRRILLEHKQYFVYAIIATVLINVLALITSLYSMQVYDRVIPNHGIDTLVALTIGVCGGIILEAVSKFLRSYIMDLAIEEMDLKLSHDIFERLVRVRMDQFPASVGTLSGQLRSYEMIRGFATSATLYLLVDTPFGLFFLFVIWLIGGELIALVPLSFFFISLLFGLSLRKRTEQHVKSSQAASHRKMGLLVETVEGAETIKGNGSTWHFLAKWNALSRKSVEEDLNIRRISEGGMFYAAGLQQLSYVVLIAVGAYIAATTTDLTTGGLIAASIISGRVLQPVTALPSLLVQWSNAKSALESLESVFRLEQDNQDTDQPIMLEHINGDFLLEKVTFSYPGRPHTLDIKNLSIKKGERVGLIGSLGSGKTTMLKLLSGMYRPQIGRVLLDGVDIQHISRTILSQKIGILPQHIRLFAGTLRENLLAGIIGVSDQRLREMCEYTGVMSIINSHSKGLDMPITEGGQGVSGGQKQCIALTRLLLSNPQIWLLDEPTASMDDATEMRALQLLSKLVRPEHTLVLVTHKPLLLNLVTRLIVLTHEGIVLDGPRDEVLRTIREQHQKQQEQQAQQAQQASQTFTTMSSTTK
ncbi:MAG: ATP-binding cassette domain-containing protein [Gammaproteobacteria bacterium]|nr:ATP-binding cassette domain-containing protein [Gammaproteobacteria bacterium]